VKLSLLGCHSFIFLLLLLMAGCAPVQMKGVNLLQSRGVALDDLQNVANMQHLKSLGANTIAFVPFVRQKNAESCELSPDPDYPAARLIRAIDLAHQAGFKVILKPQLLVEGSWAGEVASTTELGWQCWFSSYLSHLTEFATIAKDSHADMLVIGTELHKTEHRTEWVGLVKALRNIYHGHLSYVAHDVEDLADFSALEMVDSVAVTYYPKLSPTGVREQMKSLSAQVKTAAKMLNKPFWFAEIGITSRAGALADPWLWPEQTGAGVVADPVLQADVLDGWLAELAGDWHQGILIWNWYSDARAGGVSDTDFTIQNKPAEMSVSCHWKNTCR
jgi:hypothetical protein